MCLYSTVCIGARVPISVSMPENLLARFQRKTAQPCSSRLYFILKLYCTSLTLLRRSLSYKEITCAGKGKRECCRALRDRDAGIVTQLSSHGPKEDKEQRRMMQREEAAIKNDSVREGQ